MMRSKARRSTTRSRTTGKAVERQGSSQSSSPSVNSRMWSWQTVVRLRLPCAMPLIMKPQVPQIPSRQSLSKATGGRPSRVSRSLSTSSISRKDMCSETSGISWRSKAPGASAEGWRQTLRVSFTWGSARSLVAPLGRVHVLELERLLVQHRLAPLAGPLPGRHVAEALVVAQGLSVLGLVLLAEVAARALLAVARVAAHEARELEEVGHAARLLEALVQLLAGAHHLELAPVAILELVDLSDRALQALGGARHAALLPHQVPQLAVEGVDAARAADRKEARHALGGLALDRPEGGVVDLHALLAEELREVVADRVRQDEVAVGEPLHERRGAEAVGAVVGEVGLADDVEPGDRALQVVVHPQAAHRVVGRGVDPHRHVVGVLAGDALVHLEEVAVALRDHRLAEPLDGAREVEVDAHAAGPDATPLVDHALGGARGHVARPEVAEGRGTEPEGGSAPGRGAESS